MQSVIAQNIEAMRRAPRRGAGMDIVIVSTANELLEGYWQQRLEATRGQVTGPTTRVIAVREDWAPGGAGNGLGTLYALRRARAKAQDLYQEDIFARLEDGASIALYHTAGKGQRLAPLPGSESNNKPGVKLPGLLKIDGRSVPLTILEAVILQTSVYGRCRRGRVSVFWGDQIFVPDRDPHYEPTAHADILVQVDRLPDAEQWAARGLDRYGLVAMGADGNATQVEKISHARLLGLVDAKVLAVDGGIGVSLGSFSLSSPLTRELLAEFAAELEARTAKLDSDPHFWMPLGLDHSTYLEIMAAKGEEPTRSSEHHDRMRALRERLQRAEGPARILAGVDVGRGGYWWDYGQMPYYHANNLKVTENTDEGEALRAFLGIVDRHEGSRLEGVDVDEDSVVLASRVARGRIRKSVLVGVDAENLEVENAVLIGARAPAIEGRECLAYEVVDPSLLRLEPNCVASGVFRVDEDPQIMRTHLHRDGREDWARHLPGNPWSYAELYERNRKVDPGEVERAKEARRDP